MIPFAIAIGGAVASLAAAVGGVAAWKQSERHHEKKLRDKPFPKEWEAYLVENVKLYNLLPEQLQKELKGYVNLFVATKHFEGCQGVRVTDEMRVTIAALACLLLLNRKTRNYPKLRTIFIYPFAYIANPDTNEVRLGESWDDGEVVLSWNDVTRTSHEVRSGKNLVIHEFAHRLDQLDGAGDGVPNLQTESQYSAWAEVMSREFERLRKKTHKGHKTTIRPYGATNSAEFFACITETFFEKPHQLKKKHPDIYHELQEFYQLDPATWTEPKEGYLGSPFRS